MQKNTKISIYGEIQREVPSETFTEKSLVVPCLSVTVRDILTRIGNGEIVPSPPKNYDDDNAMRWTQPMFGADLTEVQDNANKILNLEAMAKKLADKYKDEVEEERKKRETTKTQNDETR